MSEGTESKIVRALYALPILAHSLGASLTMGEVVAQIGPTLIDGVKTGALALGNGETASLTRKFFGVSGLDKFLSVLVGFFTPTLGKYDAMSGMQGTSFLGDLVPLQVIMYVEGARRGNYMTAAHLFPTVIGIAYQARGLGYIAPIYFFLHYIQSPVSNFHAADQRLVQLSAVKTIIPTIILTFILPTMAMKYAPTLADRQWINGLFWQAFPLYGAICQRLLGLLVKDTTEQDRISNPEADMKHLRRAYWFAAIFGAAANILVRLTSPFPLKDVFFHDIMDPKAPVTLINGAARFLKYDQLLTFGAGAVWTLLSFKDLKAAKKTPVSWFTIISALVGGTLIAGPGATMAGMWAWREEILANSADRKKVVKKA